MNAQLLRQISILAKKREDLSFTQKLDNHVLSGIYKAASNGEDSTVFQTIPEKLVSFLRFKGIKVEEDITNHYFKVSW